MKERKLKFRAWDVESKKMITNFIDNEKAYLDKDGLLVKYCDYILMQSTEILDRNGVEIYEGDMLKNHGMNRPGVVSWNNERSMFVVGDYLCEFYAYSGDSKEVLGNIYENPSLLATPTSPEGEKN